MCVCVCVCVCVCACVRAIDLYRQEHTVVCVWLKGMAFPNGAHLTLMMTVFPSHCVSVTTQLPDLLLEEDLVLTGLREDIMLPLQSSRMYLCRGGKKKKKKSF